MTNPVLTLRDIATRENVHYQTVVDWLRDGKFGPKDKIPKTDGGYYLVPREIYEEFSKKRKAQKKG